MFQNELYINSSVSLIFNRQIDVRKKLNDFEEELKVDYTQPPQLISVPDNLDPDIPRIIYQSNHGYSSIQISQIAITLMVSYSRDEWATNLSDKGIPYLNERIPKLFRLLKMVNTELAPNYCGFKNTVHIPWVGEEQALFEILTRKYASQQSGRNLYDISLKIVEPLNDTYFSNLSISNYRVWERSSQVGAVKFPLGNEKEKGVQFVFDINDRYAFNIKPSFHSSIENLNEIMAMTLAFIGREVQYVRE